MTRWIVLLYLLLASPALAQRPDCGETTFPKHLPAVHELLDSTGVIEALTAAHWLTDSMVFTVIFTEADSLPFVSTFIGREGDGAGIVRKAVWQQQSSRMWALRVRVVGGAAPSVTFARATYCPPVPDAGPGPTMMAESRRGERLTTGPGGKIRVGVASEVNELGDVMNAWIVQSSGVADLDRQMIAWWRRKHFLPAMIDLQRVRGLFRSDQSSPRL